MSFNDIFSLDFEQFLGNVKTSDINKRWYYFLTDNIK